MTMGQIKEKIQQRRRQMIVHSYIYYEMNTSVVSDEDWTRWAMELVELQKKYPEIAREADYWEDFQDWDGSTGFHLPFWKYPWLVGTADFLVKKEMIT